MTHYDVMSGYLYSIYISNKKTDRNYHKILGLCVVCRSYLCVNVTGKREGGGGLL